MADNKKNERDFLVDDRPVDISHYSEEELEKRYREILGEDDGEDEE